MRSALRILWSGKIPLVLAGCIGFAAAAWYVSRIPSAYRSQATILVLPQVVPQNMVRSTVTQSLDDRLRSLSDRVFAPARVAKLASDLKLYPELGGDATAAGQRLRSLTGVEMVRADAFRVTFIHRNPVLAARVADQLAKSFVAENINERTGLAEETDRFIENQLQSTRERLAEHEAQLEDYRRKYAGQLPSQLSSNLQVIQNAQIQLRALADSIHEDRDQKLQVEDTLARLTAEQSAVPDVATASASRTATFDPLVDEATQLRGREALQALPRVRATLRSMELQLKPDHPDIIRLKRIIGELEQRAALDPDAGTPDAPNAPNAGAAARADRVKQLRADLAALNARLDGREAEEAQLKDQIERYQQRVELIPTRETELTTLMRDYDTLRESYNTLLTKKEDSQMAAELERRSVGETMKIIEPARVPGAPFSPNRPESMLTGLLAGLAVGLTIIGWRELQDTALRTEAEVLAGLAVPVIALIPMIASARDERRARLRRAAVLASAACLIAAVVLLFYFRSGLNL